MSQQVIKRVLYSLIFVIRVNEIFISVIRDPPFLPFVNPARSPLYDPLPKVWKLSYFLRCNRTVYSSGEDQTLPVSISALCTSFQLVFIRGTPTGKIIILSCVTTVPSRRMGYQYKSLILKTLPLFQEAETLI